MSLSSYLQLIEAKRVSFTPRGLDRVPALSSALMDHQRHSVEFALRVGCAALFLDTGLGKTLCALEWGRVVVEHTGLPVLMLAPLAVAAQHEREAVKFGIDAKAVREPEQIDSPRVYITNYDRLAKFDAGQFAGVILDESSIIKSFSGQTTKALIAAFRETPFRLCCTATPAPNDHAELGQHAEFLGVMSQTQMLTRWFIHDSADTGNWRMKGHAVQDFWNWVASWARCVSKPSDLGFSDDGYVLPALNLRRHIVEADRSLDAGAEKDGQARLFRMPDTSATSIHREKRMTTQARAEVIASLVRAEPDEPWVVWCDTDYEADALAVLLPEAVEVRGSMSPETKEANLTAFSTGHARVIITKPSIAGFGLNWQHAARMAFVGLSFSYESFYQAVRRCWRFGQARPVNVHVACADTEESIWQIVSRKAGDHDAMKSEMAAAMSRASRSVPEQAPYQPAKTLALPRWIAA
ncbi:MAG: helicase-related protein [Caulobacter sp.]